MPAGDGRIAKPQARATNGRIRAAARAGRSATLDRPVAVHVMRSLFLPFVLMVAAPVVHAQQRPLDLEPVPEPPPPAVGFDAAPDAPGVTIAPPEGKIEEELTADGQRVVRVTTPEGLEYVMMQDQGDMSFAVPRTGDSGVRTPQWVILRW
jgi:hypothetical protein